MHYYYLQPDDIIKEGDEYCFSGGTEEWRRCRDSIGRTQAEHSRDLGRSNWRVRRKLRKTKLGNSL